MANSSTLSTPVHEWLYRARLPLLALTWLALIVYFQTPVREVMDVWLDSSNYTSYAYFTAHKFQYGTEVVPMAGPYGFVMYGWDYSGDLFWTRLVCEVILNAALATLTLWFFIRNRGSALRWVWLAAHIAFTSFIEDLPIEWTLILAGIFLLQTPRRPGFSPWPLLVVGLMAFLSLVKGTHLVLGLATLGVVLGGFAWLRQWRYVAILAGSYIVWLLFWWVLAGQNISHLPAYVRGILELSSGYNDAMSIEGPDQILFRGVLISAALAVSLGWALWLHRRDTITIASLLLFAGHSFVQWKHAFVRADGHSYIYFYYAIVAAFAIYLVAYRLAAIKPGRLATSAGFALLLLVVGFSCYNSNESPLDWRDAPAKALRRLKENGEYLTTLPAEKAGFDREMDKRRRLYAMPLTQHAVGERSIDVFGFEHARIRFNDLNYRPRPMGGGPFNVYSPALMQLNHEFIRDPARRPDFYLVRLQTLDERLLAADDGLAFRDIIQIYRPLLVEQNHLLMKAIPDAILPEPHLLAEKNFQIGDNVPVPEVGSDQLLLVRFDLRRSLLGLLRSVLYKVPRVRIALQGEGIAQPNSHRLISGMAASPFLLSPIIENNRDFVELYTARSSKLPREFRISTSDRTWFNKTVRAEFYTVPRPATAPGNEVNEILRFTQSDTEMITTVTADTGASITINGLLCHPPSRFSWPLEGNEKSLIFGYGIVPAAYDQTDGVEFLATLLRPGFPSLRLFDQLLETKNRPADRGHHLVTIPLGTPLPPGSRLEFSTTPGPSNNTAFDWAYVSDLHFSILPR